MARPLDSFLFGGAKELRMNEISMLDRRFCLLHNQRVRFGVEKERSYPTCGPPPSERQNLRCRYLQLSYRCRARKLIGWWQILRQPVDSSPVAPEQRQKRVCHPESRHQLL